jgi:hypothetical protein
VSVSSHQPHEPGNTIPAINRRERKVWQVGLRTMFLLIAAIAVWLTYFINRRHNATLVSRIRAMAPLAHELIVDNPKKIAVVKLEQYWFDDDRWEIYLPDGQYRLCVATRGIEEGKLAQVTKSQPIKAGRHHVALVKRLDKDIWRVTVAWDGAGLLAVEEPKDWDPGIGSFNDCRYSVSEQLAAEKPAVLFRARFMREIRNGQGLTRDGPTEGILLWIEKVGGSDAGP